MASHRYLRRFPLGITAGRLSGANNPIWQDWGTSVAEQRAFRGAGKLPKGSGNRRERRLVPWQVPSQAAADSHRLDGSGEAA